VGERCPGQPRTAVVLGEPLRQPGSAAASPQHPSCPGLLPGGGRGLRPLRGGWPGVGLLVPPWKASASPDTTRSRGCHCGECPGCHGHGRLWGPLHAAQHPSHRRRWLLSPPRCSGAVSPCPLPAMDPARQSRGLCQGRSPGESGAKPGAVSSGGKQLVSSVSLCVLSERLSRCVCAGRSSPRGRGVLGCAAGDWGARSLLPTPRERHGRGPLAISRRSRSHM